MQKKKFSQKNKINELIQAESVRLVDEEGNSSIISIEEALSKARAADLDLVEVATASGNDQPVCKIFDYGKHAYDSQRSLSNARKKQKSTIKELRFRVNIDEHDYNVKLNQVRGFIEKGDKVRLHLKFTGRENLHVNVGMNVFHRLISDTEDIAKVESNPAKEGNMLTMVLTTKK